MSELSVEIRLADASQPEEAAKALVVWLRRASYYVDVTPGSSIEIFVNGEAHVVWTGEGWKTSHEH